MPFTLSVENAMVMEVFILMMSITVAKYASAFWMINPVGNKAIIHPQKLNRACPPQSTNTQFYNGCSALRYSLPLNLVLIKYIKTYPSLLII
jgi:hypothetical protein